MIWRMSKEGSNCLQIKVKEVMVMIIGSRSKNWFCATVLPHCRTNCAKANMLIYIE